jgi:hypothetical protein
MMKQARHGTSASSLFLWSVALRPSAWLYTCTSLVPLLAGPAGSSSYQIELIRLPENPLAENGIATWRGAAPIPGTRRVPSPPVW